MGGESFRLTALKRARTLATSENDVLDQIGTRIPELIKRVLPWL